MESETKRRVATGCFTSLAVVGQSVAGLLYALSYSPDPIGNDAGYMGRSAGLPDSGLVHAVIIATGIVGILATVLAAKMGPQGRRWPHITGIVASVVGFVAAAMMSHDVNASGGGLAMLALGFSVNLLIGVAVASGVGFVATWPRSGAGLTPPDALSPSTSPPP
ncbi:hypothetical protein LGT39_14300 [Demequina sp. TTPB684]|uniref:hypothetical protein n=1 Tax=unclassified Demequina TaxID=2620311 RepID=UPI001CF3A830|nr:MULTISPECIES: hypothetical protein [unclassified Demequina]MCB2414019.1 hypothetical protein [Demequina sp. TTPB684]UPU89100.1 hypothetical protein LGT36_004030 [Demequina sp. TMPB413]